MWFPEARLRVGAKGREGAFLLCPALTPQLRPPSVPCPSVCSELLQPRTAGALTFPSLRGHAPGATGLRELVGQARISD